MNNNNLVETLMTAQEVVTSTSNDIADSIRPLFFDKDEKFLYSEVYEELERYDAKLFEIDEFPGWLWTCSTDEEGGGHYSYNVVGFKPGSVSKDQKRWTSKADVIINIYWD